MCRKTEEARNAGPELKVPYFSDLQATFQAELNKIVPFGFSLQRQKMVFFFAIKIVKFYCADVCDLVTLWKSCLMVN